MLEDQDFGNMFEENTEKKEEETKMDNTNTDASTVTIDSETGLVDSSSMKKVCTKAEARAVEDMAETLGIKSSVTKTEADRYEVTLIDVDDRQMSVLQRKMNIQSWSVRTMKVANAITDFATDVADYAFNGALAPAGVAVANAALTTGRVVGTAAVKFAAGTTASAIRNGRAAAVELAHSPEIKDCRNEISGLWGDISGKLFGPVDTTNQGWARC